MKTPKIKRYRLGVSRTFPATHPRKGEETYFVEKIYCGKKWFGICDGCEHRDCGHCEIALNPKTHTIRSNYPLWEKRMKEVQAGRAVIELFYWEDKPYRSKQVVFATLDKNSGCGVQELKMVDHGNFTYLTINNPNEKPHIHSDCVDFEQKKSCVKLIQYLSENDGLSFEDFKDWFKGYDLSKKMAIIHFTKFRY